MVGVGAVSSRNLVPCENCEFYTIRSDFRGGAKAIQYIVNKA